MSLCGVPSSVHPCLHHAAPLPFASARSSTTHRHDACDLSGRLPLCTLVCVPSPHSLARARSPLITHTFLFAATMSACKPRLFPRAFVFLVAHPPSRRPSADCRSTNCMLQGTSALMTLCPTGPRTRLEFIGLCPLGLESLRFCAQRKNNANCCVAPCGSAIEPSTATSRARTHPCVTVASRRCCLSSCSIVRCLISSC